MKSKWLLGAAVLVLLSTTETESFIIIKLAFLVIKLALKVILLLLIGKRRRRSVDKRQLKSFYNYLQLAQKLDDKKCIPRSICEVMATGPHEGMGEFEKAIMTVFGNHSSPIVEDLNNPKSPGYAYQIAAMYGQLTGSHKACVELYSRCTEKFTYLHKLMDQTDTMQHFCL